MSKATEDEIRLDERRRISDLLSEHAEIIADFAADKHRAVLLSALVLRLGELPPRVAEMAGTTQ